MTRHWHRLPCAGMLALACGWAAAGPVEVTVRTDPRYLDAGSSRVDEERNLKVLSDHLKALGRRHLPEGQSLQVELVEVDLAGETRPLLAGPDEVRIARGRADWPRLTVNYTLKSADGQLLKTGEDRLSDMGYLQHLPGARNDDPLRHEKRMLDEWFVSRFTEGRRGDR